eukprot:CAMPEP_0172478680 /NCGR_PEP_ID=MMETSP1066-20121228/2781_1 /TAXON_ID=671091 /ORGANISM="Coscinodiscus wailesii, Strain CCMP2513" /LENGTH=55 /DNA_ID=CAMNT_0013238467 /DNA_START=49 /DNA_END=212 /DNA_ORIENTATION=-
MRNTSFVTEAFKALEVIRHDAVDDGTEGLFVQFGSFAWFVIRVSCEDRGAATAVG